MFWILLPDNRSQNNIFFFLCSRKINLSFNGYIIPANILFIVNVIFTDGIRVFLNTLTKKIEANCKITIFCSGIINLLFDGLAYNTSGHFAHCSYFPRPCGARKNTTQLAKYPHVLYAKPSNKVYFFYVFSININLTFTVI